MPASAFGNRRQLKQLEEDRAVLRMVTGRNRASIRCPDPAALENYLRLHFGITDLGTYLNLLDQADRDGEDSLLATTSTKTFRRKGMQGFFIKAFSTPMHMGGHALDTLPDGVEYFVHDPASLRVSSSALIVGVENPECFVKIDRLIHRFPQEELVVVMRYHSLSPVEWLKSVENHYLHFGDFDPAGIAIYCNEYLARLGERRCRFFVPEQIEKILEQKGSGELFDQQAHLWPPKQGVDQPDLQGLVRLISRTGKGAEQELLLSE
ncbi:hypothetical protein P4E94_17295 [Pontiellaceae bacterium B12219]|nr:hypothetical protein [Pontiellaceae bacterium B12219]